MNSPKQAKHTPPIKKMIQLGIPVGLGTDVSPGSPISQKINMASDITNFYFKHNMRLYLFLLQISENKTRLNLKKRL